MEKLSKEELQSLKAQAMIPERGGERFSVRVSVVGGQLNATQLEKIAWVAKTYGDGSLHLTTRQGVEIPHVPYENLTPAKEALAEGGVRMAATGRCVRAVIACPGSYCVHGSIDTLGLADKIHARFGLRSGLPHKFKIAVAGCLNGCTKPRENDLGVMGVGHRYTVFVGGKMGKQPRLADVLPVTLPDEQRLLDTIEAILAWFVANGQPGERFGSTIERVGLDKLVESLGIE